MSSTITGGTPTSAGVTITGGVSSADLDDALYTYLLGYAALNSLVSDRIYPDFMKQNETLPAIVYTADMDQSAPIQEGVSALRRAEYRFAIWADSLASVSAVEKQIRAALDGYKGVLGPLPYFTAALSSSGSQRGRDPETQAFFKDMPFIFHYRES